MEEIKELMFSPTFWLASVIVAFLMSFFSAYAKEFVDKKIEKRSKEKDNIAKEKQTQFNTKVEKLKTCPHTLALYQSNIIYQKLRQVLYYTSGYVGLILSLYSSANMNIIATLATLGFALMMFFIPGRSVSKKLYELRSVVNAALDDDDSHFFG